MEVNPELPIVAVTKRGDPRDVLVLPEGCSNQEEISLNGLLVGSSSLRRKLQLKKMYPDVQIENIRGNIQTRLRKLDEGNFDGIILAAAGLQRANLSERISRVFSVEEILPAAGQGILAIQARKDNNLEFLNEVCDQDTMTVAIAERSFVRALEGGCSSPVAAYATIEGQVLTLRGLYYKESTGEFFRETTSGHRSDADKIGEEFAKYMKYKYKN